LITRSTSLDHAQHVALARQFGEPTIGHAVFGYVDEHPEIYSVAKNRTANENREAMPVTPWSGWHADITAAVNPPAASILRGVTIPPYGGDTFWTNLVAAYSGLSPTMRRFVDRLRGIHAFVPREAANTRSEYNERVKRRVLRSEHPLVTVHAETGERVLYASPSFLKSIVGLTPREKPEDPRNPMGARNTAGIYRAVQVERGRHRVLGQPVYRASCTARHLRIRLRPPALSRDLGREAARWHRRKFVTLDRGRADPVGIGGAAYEGRGGIVSAAAGGSASTRLTASPLQARRIPRFSDLRSAILRDASLAF
jgi:TfdA family taurine catabolism dioxygenase TauD